jgi:hypothetical protein
VADRPRFPADVAVQYFRRLVDTFAKSTGARHSTGDNRMKMIGLPAEIITTLFV